MPQMAVAQTVPRAARTPASDVLPKVRLAVPDDEEPILAMCRRLHAENGLFSLNEEKVRDLVRRYYERKGTTIGVVGPVGAPEGVICLMFSEQYYTNDWHLAEVWNFVDEPFRQSRNAEALVAFAKRCADEVKLPLIIGIITRSRTAAKVGLYRRLLGAPAGAFWVHNGQWVNDDALDGKVWKDMLSEKTRLREVPAGARVIPPDVLQRLGDGDIDRGRARLDAFLARKPNGSR